jgi:hypothetical protein
MIKARIYQKQSSLKSIRNMSGSTIFFHIISQTARLPEKKVTEHKLYFHFLYDFCLKDVSF